MARPKKTDKLSEYTIEQLRKMELLTKIEKEQLLIQEKKREIVSLSDVTRLLAEITKQTRDAFLSLPKKLALSLAGQEPNQIEKILDEEVRAILQSLQENITAWIESQKSEVIEDDDTKASGED